MDLFKIVLGLKVCGVLNPPKPTGCYDSGMWNVKQKDNEMDQNTHQCCYGHNVTTTEQT